MSIVAIAWCLYCEISIFLLDRQQTDERTQLLNPASCAHRVITSIIHWAYSTVNCMVSFVLVSFLIWQSAIVVNEPSMGWPLFINPLEGCYSTRRMEFIMAAKAWAHTLVHQEHGYALNSWTVGLYGLREAGTVFAKFICKPINSSGWRCC